MSRSTLAHLNTLAGELYSNDRIHVVITLICSCKSATVANICSTSVEQIRRKICNTLPGKQHNVPDAVPISGFAEIKCVCHYYY